MEVTRKIEIDAGHRIPNHKSKCRNIHGHRYVFEATLSGPIQDAQGTSEDGMVLDFGDVKRIMMEQIHEPWDHAFLMWNGDQNLESVRNILLQIEPAHKIVLLDCVPTAENLAEVAFKVLDTHFQQIYGNDLVLTRVRVYETPNCWADATRKS